MSGKRSCTGLFLLVFGGSDGFVILSLFAIGGSGTADAPFFHGFISTDVGFRKFLFFGEKCGYSKSNEGKANECKYDDKNGPKHNCC